MILSLLNRKKTPSEFQQLSELLLHSVSRIATSANEDKGLRELAQILRERETSPQMVRDAVCSAVYPDNDSAAEQLMGKLARFGFGPGGLTLKQPDRVVVNSPADSPPSTAKTQESGLCNENLIAALNTPSPYAAILVGDSGVGLTTLIQALIGVRLKHPCQGISLAVLDLLGEPDWLGLGEVENTLAVLPSRDPKFLSLLSEYIGQIAKEIQSRSGQQTIKQRSPRLGASSWPPMMIAINGWQAAADVIDGRKNEQIRQLLSDLRYCLSSGPKFNVTVLIGCDRLSSMAVPLSSLNSTKVFGLGRMDGSAGGYRAVDEIAADKYCVPSVDDRTQLIAAISQCKSQRIPIVLGLSGLTRLGVLRDFRDPSLKLGALYQERLER